MKAWGLLLGAGMLALAAGQADATVLLTFTESGSADPTKNVTQTAAYSDFIHSYQNTVGDFNVTASYFGSQNGTTPDLFTQTLNVSASAAATLTVTIQQIGLTVANLGSLLSTFTANGSNLSSVVESTYANGNLLASQTFGPNINGTSNLGASYTVNSAGVANLSSDAVRFVIDAKAGGAVSNATINLQSAPGAVPEPASWAMMLAGFGFMGYALRQRRRATVSFG